MNINDFESRFNPASIPHCMTARDQWVVVKLESNPKDPNKPIKVPYNARTGGGAMTNKSSTWSPFSLCAEKVQGGEYEGVGYCFAREDGLTGIDLDRCLQADGKPEPWVLPILAHFSDCWIEKTWSGKGLHIWCKGEAVKTGKDPATKQIEVYNYRSPRYFFVTGDTFQDGKIKNAQSGLYWLYANHFEEEAPRPTRTFTADDDQKIVLEWLDAIPADDYETWIQVGMALKAGDYPLEVWDQWSSKGNGYDPKVCAKKWKTFKRSGKGIGSLHYLATQNGWSPPERSERVIRTETRRTELKPEKEPEIGLDFETPLVKQDITGNSNNQMIKPTVHPSLPPEAKHGLAGKIADLATKDSEADPAAILITVLTYYSAIIGTNSFLRVGEEIHHARLFVAVVGASSRARKGTSKRPVIRIFDRAEELLQPRYGGTFQKLKLSPGPLSSGEGVVYAVRDSSEETNKEGEPTDTGIEDKRLLVLEDEFGAALSSMNRQGNTLSAILRQAWDGGSIEPLTKKDRIKSTGAHINIVGHITRHELEILLQKSDIFNGFANRFLWVCSRRQKIVPLPRPMDSDVVEEISKELSDAIDFGRYALEVTLADDTRKYWEGLYPSITRDEPGLVGVVTSRAEAQVLRLSLIFALIDCQNKIAPVHLKAAIALWQYCRESCKYIFGDRNHDPNKSKILDALKTGPKTLSEVNAMFNGHFSSAKLNQLLIDLQSDGSVTCSKEKTGGRPRQIWQITGGFEQLYAE